jgi:type IV secretion system protein VirB5
MRTRHFASLCAVSASLLLTAVPARAGIPVIDGTNLAQQIQQVVSWGQQARQMINQIQQLQQQFQQLQTMTSKLEGVRSLGSILNDPAIRSVLPPEMRDATQLLLNPSALAISQANLNQILASFGVTTSLDPTAGKAIADTLGRAQQILASTQTRQTQLAALATRVDTTADAKDSLDMLNRNVLEAANINNQIIQTMAALEAARKTTEMQQVARDQQFGNSAQTGAARPIRVLTY